MARKSNTDTAAPAAPDKRTRNKAAGTTATTNATEGGRRRSRAAAPEAPTVEAPDTTQADAERVAERCANAQRAVDVVQGWTDVITAATSELDDDAARAAAEQLGEAATAVKRALAVRTQRPPRLRSPKD